MAVTTVYATAGAAHPKRPDGATQLWCKPGRNRCYRESVRYSGYWDAACFEGELIPGFRLGDHFRVTYAEDERVPSEAARNLRITVMRMFEAAERAAQAEDFARADRFHDSAAQLSHRAAELEALASGDVPTGDLAPSLAA